MFKYLLSILFLSAAVYSNAQSPTTVTNASNCLPFRNFNTSGEGFSSPSIYSGADDVAFDWSSTSGAEIESSGLTVRTSSLISPVYTLTTSGNTTIGFRYIAPIGTEYRVRILSGVIGAPLEVIATTANGPVYTPLPALSGTICIMLTDADLIAGRQIRFEFTFRSTHSGDVLFDDLTQGVALIPLPVTFEGFVARKNTNGTIKLLWNVGEEQNVKGYYVESSTDGLNFTTAGYVDARGQSIYSMDYTGKLAPTLYFKVRNIDFDGKSKYTPIIRVYNKDIQNQAIQVYPLPATDQVTIQHSETSANAMVMLLSPDGKILQQVQVAPHTYQTQLNIRSIAAGIYFIRFNDGKGNYQTTQLIKH